MISTNQYRASIGMWNLFCGTRHKVPNSSNDNSHQLSIKIVIIILLLLTSGDIHPNPGPANSSKQTQICHINARSLMTYDIDTCSYMKFEEIKSQLIHTMKADILCVSETWLDQSISDLDIKIVNYAIHRHDRNRHGGGVAIYVSDSLAVTRRPDLEYDDIESVWLEITTDKKKILLASYYRPPVSHGQRAIVIKKNSQQNVNFSHFCNSLKSRLLVYSRGLQ